MKHLIRNVVKIVGIFLVILFICVSATGCTTKKVEPQVEQAEQASKCTREVDMNTYSLSTYIVRCPEANYRCIHGVYALQCFKLEE